VKRCICGKSATLPLCDGAHSTEGWVCNAENERHIPVAVMATGSLQNLADRLAHQLGGASVRGSAQRIDCARLIVISDGQDVTALQRSLTEISATKRTLIAVGIQAGFIGRAFEGFDVVAIEDGPPAQLWRSVLGAVDQVPEPIEIQSPPRVFLSHSVADEGRLFGVVESLRRDFGVDVFVCADSIRSGSRWHDEIRSELQGCDALIFISSTQANVSVFCAFETGYAAALGKPLHIIGLDGDGPPTHLSDVQAIDVLRLKARKPWLAGDEALLEAFLTILQR
jgi:hypothetical protein